VSPAYDTRLFILIRDFPNERENLPSHFPGLIGTHIDAFHQIGSKRIEFRSLFGKALDVHKNIPGKSYARFPAYVNHFSEQVSAASFPYGEIQIADLHMADRNQGFMFLWRIAVKYR